MPRDRDRAKRITQYYKEGLNAGQIAYREHVTKRYVYLTLQHSGIHVKEPQKKDKTPSATTLQRKQLLEKIGSLYDKGMSVADIAKELNYSRGQIFYYFRTYPYLRLRKEQHDKATYDALCHLVGSYTTWVEAVKAARKYERLHMPMDKWRLNTIDPDWRSVIRIQPVVLEEEDCG